MASIFDWITGLATGGLSLIGSAINSASQRKAVQQTNAANMELAKYQNEQNLAQWERENEYNKPVNALNRLREAGVNPALINGSTVDAGTAGTMRYVRPTMQPQPGIDLGLDKAAQYALIDSEIALNKAKARKENASSGLDEWTLHFNEVTENFQKEYFLYRNEATKANKENLLAAIRQRDEQLKQARELLDKDLLLKDEQITQMAFTRDLQTKELDLKTWQIGEAIKQGWKNLEISGALAASTIERNSWLNKLTNVEIGEVYETMKNLIVDGKNKELDNYLKQLDAYWKEKGLKVGGNPVQLANLLFAIPLERGIIPVRSNSPQSDNYNMPVRPRTVTSSGYDSAGNFYEVSE